MGCIWFLLSCLLLQGHAMHTYNRQKRVAKGSSAGSGDYKFQVSIQQSQIKKYHHCGGVILNEKKILTAAHCVDGFDPEDFKVVAGTVNLNSAPVSIMVSKIKVHEKYQASTWTNDLAILTLESAIPMGGNIEKARLATFQELRDGSTATIVGFGRTSAQSGSSDTLKKAEVTVRSLDLCNERYKKAKLTVTDSQICVHDSDNRGMCKGDSGGPLVSNGVVYGITSFTSDGCADSGFPSIFVKVSKYSTWIQNNSK